MFRRLAAALLAIALAPAALAKDSQCTITYKNQSGSDFKGSAALWKGDTLQIGGTIYSNANGNNYPFDVSNGDTLVIQANESEKCDIVSTISNDAESAFIKSEVEATGSSSKADCFEDDENKFKEKYGCSCTNSKSGHSATISITCAGG